MEEKGLTAQEQAYWDFMTAAECCQWAWVAGIIDGEGSVSIQRKADGNLEVLLRVSMTHELTVRTIKVFAHVGKVRQDKSRMSSGGKDVWEWRVKGKKAVSTLRQCMPFLVTKKVQARIALEFALLANRGHPLSLANKEKRQALREAMLVLNKKGPGKSSPKTADG